MEHADALEQIEIAAAEPDGLERLMAGDTPDAAAVAGHLAGCPACVDEMARIRRASAIVREVIVAEPDPALRERTLAFVRDVGRDRSSIDRAESAATGTLDAAGRPRLAALPDLGAGPDAAAPFPVSGRAGPSRLARRRRPPLAWVAGIAAALVVAGALGYGAGVGLRAPDTDGRDTEVAVLQDATAAAVRIAAEPDARHVELVATGGGDAAGSLVFSPTRGELVMIATDLAPEPAGQWYSCWVEQDGQRRRLGRMYWAGELWAWAGPANGLAALPAGTVFGVSLGPVGGGAGGADPVLTGQL